MVCMKKTSYTEMQRFAKAGCPCGDAYPSSFAGSISSVTVGASLVVSSPLSIVSVMIVP